MVSDSVLVHRLREILRVSDLEISTAGTVRRRLEEEFGVDLLDRKAFIRDQIDLFLRTHVEETPNDDVHEAENDKEGENDDSCSQEKEEEKSVNVKEDENGDSCSQEEEDESATGAKKKARYDILLNFISNPSHCIDSIIDFVSVNCSLHSNHVAGRHSVTVDSTSARKK